MLILGIIILTVLTSGCQNAKDTRETQTQTQEVKESETVSEDNTEANDDTKASEESDLTSLDSIDYDLNPLTGMTQEKGTIANRPLAIMFDNQYSARPQAGLIDADVAYEMLAEGLITRYMGIFYGNLPEHLGPIRSSRPYFLLKALEFNPFYVHVGGSMQALSDIKTYKMADIDGLTSGAFHRESHKKIPHNMYSEAQTLINDGLKRGYDESVEIDFLAFNPEFTPLVSDAQANEIKFVYKTPTSSDKTGYYTTYKYSEVQNFYYRYTNEDAHLDEDTGRQLFATNILVQYVSQKVLDSEGRLELGLVGEGKGMYYTGGLGVEVTWKKATVKDSTRFYNLDGNEIKLNPGKTWFQIMPKGSKEEIIR